MFVKVFEHILDSSIADDYELRHFFEDMLKLADWKTGVVDMTESAIARRLNFPIEKVGPLLRKLEAPDRSSKSPELEGRRIVLIDEHRAWGWRIVNYEKYRDIRNEEDLKVKNRDAKRRERLRKGTGRLKPGESRVAIGRPAKEEAQDQVTARYPVEAPRLCGNAGIRC